MKSQPLEVAFLFDYYGAILTEKQRDYFDYYYHHDLSLTEIAENEGITRQGVRDIISRAEAILRDMEAKLHLVARFQNVASYTEQIVELTGEVLSINSARYGNESIHSLTCKIHDLAMELMSKSNLEDEHGL